MIKEFAVENFLSFRDRQEISFEATPDKTSESSLIYNVIHPKTNSITRILRMSVIYGANASGKTNLLVAIDNVFKILSKSKTFKENEIEYQPFALSNGAPTKMEVTFFIDGIEYNYKIEYNTVIQSEELRFNPNGVMSLFYNRIYDKKKNIPIITFGDNAAIDKVVAEKISDHTYNNHSVLSTFEKLSIYVPQIEVVYNWIKSTVKDFYIAGEENKINEIGPTIVDMIRDEDRKKFFMEYISSSDFNISDIFYEEQKTSIPRNLKYTILEDVSIPYETKSKILTPKNVKVDIEHTTEDGEKFVLPLHSESKGTLMSMSFGSKFYDMLTSKSLFLIDEIDNALHYDLLIYFIQKFLINDHSSQLIFSTHHQMLLDESFIRRDMVWFAQKSKETSSSELFSVVDFKLHKNLSIFNAYKSGRFGAKPEIGSPFVYNR